jgi:uncharacterized protein Usg
MPDHPALLQSYVWQSYDLPPDYPELRRFLEFWRLNLDGAVHSVRVAHSTPFARPHYRHVDCSFLLH